ncbi:MAG: SGNH/GDSL hydrolase family protein [Verrucomicrobia bacterium]|nr:SGNH/GDSL hydrolase family protein [Verrucomicrobiota bacterium]
MQKTPCSVVFQGDSITDCGRNANQEPDAPGNFGNGYVRILCGRLPQLHPQRAWTFFNRGISGHKITQLYARWQKDTLNLQPDVLSILVGVNDVWHGFKRGDVYDGVPLSHFIRSYDALLDFTIEQMPAVRIILGEPFLIQGSAWTEEFAEELTIRAHAIRDLATRRGLALVPYQKVFTDALQTYTVDELAPDGVHPTILGHTLMADAWLNTFKTLNNG